MLHRSTAFALLLLSGLLLFAGPYPCRARAAAPAAPDSCHEEHAAGDPSIASRDAPPAPDCCGDGSDVLCEHACQGAAILAVAPQESAAEPAVELRAIGGGHLLPPLPHGLDHIPLA